MTASVSRPTLGLFAMALALGLLLGCANESTAPKKSEQPSAGSETKTVEPDNFPSIRGGERIVIPADAAANKEAAPLSNKVLLGSADLTAGIPGEGDLTVAQIETWLAKPENHETLEVELPLGLSLGKAQIAGIDKNPMTRAKIELGRQLYFDTRLSADNTVSCASCHAPDEGFARHTQFGVGIDEQEGGRNSPISYNRIVSGAQFWDGRAASLEEQAVGPIQSPIEMGNTHEKAVATVKGIEGYRLQFDRVFGSDGVTIDNIGAAIATFERAIVTGSSPFDYDEQIRPFTKLSEEDLAEYLEDDADFAADYKVRMAAAKANPMSEGALRGRELFFSKKVGCTTCHVGANLTDEKYHNLGVGMDKEKPDLGRYEVTKEDKDRGAFKTPTIRNVVHSAPYLHDGSHKTLEEVVELYAKGGVANPNLSEKIKKIDLSAQDKADLVEFMKACSGAFPVIETGRLP